jgi:putative restriction endonuclease
MARRSKDWTREEHIIAFNLYCQIPFGRIHMGNPRIVELARLIGRSVGSVSYKLSNFARLDPALRTRGIRGSSHGAKGEEEVWQGCNDAKKTVLYPKTPHSWQNFSQSSFP